MADVLSLGFDPERLERVRASLERDIEAERCDGAALVVGRRGEVALHATCGFADRGAGRRLAEDDVFVTMSIGKQFTNALVLACVERGELPLHQPVAEWIPGFEARGKGGITLFHLLTHTSGIISEVPGLPPEVLANIDGLTEWAAGSLPQAQPGERVNYSILVAHAVLASLVLRAVGRGRRFGEVLREELFEPLDMRDTSLGPRPDLLKRLCPVRACYSEPGLFDPAELAGLADLLLLDGGEIPAGGFVTTARDLHRFTEMLRGGGALDGRRLLSPALLAYARQNHTGEAPNSLMEYTHGYRGWAAWPAYIGLGFFVRGERPTPGPFGNLSSPQTFGGWGAGSTAFWVDPERELSFSLLTTGLMEDSRHIERVARLSDLVTASLVD